MQVFADTIIENGKVAAMVEEGRFDEALAIKDGRIAAVGTASEIALWAGPETVRIDAGGRTVLPGFVECHVHADLYGARIHRWADFSYPKVRSKDEVLSIIAERAATLPADAWCAGFRYDDNKLGGYPTREELDQAGGGRPVFVFRTDCHLGVASSEALRRAKLGGDYPDPPFGRTDRHPETGEPTGLLRENAAYAVIDEIMRDYTADDFAAGLGTVFAEFLSYGITSLHNSLTTSHGIRAYQTLRREGRLPMRIGVIVSGKEDGLVESVIRSGIRSGFGDEWVRIVGVEWCPDCSTSGRTAAYYEPYIGKPIVGEPENNTGMLLYSPEDFTRRVTEATAAGLTVCADGVGDRGVDFVLDAFEAALAAHPSQDHRMRVEHSCCVPPAIRERMKRLGVIPTSATGFMYDLGEAYIANRGAAAMKDMFPHRSWKELGVIAPGHSDAPICHPNPMRGIYSLVTRRTDRGGDLDGSEAVGVWDALRAYTYDGAYAGREEHLKGTLEPGKLADIAILDADVFTVDAERIPEIASWMTLVDGKVVHGAA